MITITITVEGITQEDGVGIATNIETYGMGKGEKGTYVERFVTMKLVDILENGVNKIGEECSDSLAAIHTIEQMIKDDESEE